MLAVTFGPRSLQLTEVQEPVIGRSDHAIVDVHAVGICGSDLRMIRAPGERVGNIFGHEISGVLQAAGPDVGLKPGQAVTINPNVPCQDCRLCRSGQPNLCDNLKGIGSTLHGGAALRVVVPSSQLHPLPPELDLDVAALAEPLSCVIRGLRRTAEPLSKAAYVVGAGPIGLLVILVLRMFGVAEITVLEQHPERQHAARRLGADIVVASPEEGSVIVAETTGGRGVDLAVDASAGMLGHAAINVRKGGRILALGFGGEPDGRLSETIVMREIAIVTSFTGFGAMPTAIDLLAEHPMAFAPLISHRLPLTEAVSAIALLESGIATKVLLLP